MRSARLPARAGEQGPGEGLPAGRKADGAPLPQLAGLPSIGQVMAKIPVGVAQKTRPLLAGKARPVAQGAERGISEARRCLEILGTAQDPATARRRPEAVLASGLIQAFRRIGQSSSAGRIASRGFTKRT